MGELGEQTEIFLYGNFADKEVDNKILQSSQLFAKYKVFNFMSVYLFRVILEAEMLQEGLFKMDTEKAKNWEYFNLPENKLFYTITDVDDASIADELRDEFVLIGLNPSGIPQYVSEPLNPYETPE